MKTSTISPLGTRTAIAVLAAGLTLTSVAVSGIPAAAAEPTAPAPTARPSGKSAASPAPVPPPCGPLTTTPPLGLPGTAVPAGPLLRTIAAHLHTVPADRERGRYTVLVKHSTAADTTVADCVTTVTDASTSTLWRDELRDSGMTYGVAPHPAADPAPAPSRETYGPGELRGVFPGRVPASPARIGQLLDQRYPQPGARVTGTGEITEWHDTPPAARRALLTVLAGVPGVRAYRGVTVDDRTGIAVTFDVDNYGDPAADVRTVLLIDPTSGEIFAYEQVLLNPAIGHNLGVTVPFQQELIVITGRGRTNRAGVLPATGLPV